MGRGRRGPAAVPSPCAPPQRSPQISPAHRDGGIGQTRHIRCLPAPGMECLPTDTSRANRASRRCVAHWPCGQCCSSLLGRARPCGARRRGACGPLTCRPAFFRPQVSSGGEPKARGADSPPLQRRGQKTTPRATAPLPTAIQGTGVQGGRQPPLPGPRAKPAGARRCAQERRERFSKRHAGADWPCGNAVKDLGLHRANTR